MELSKDSFKFLIDGFVLGIVNDLRSKGKLNFVQNCRVITEGVLESRPAIEDIITLNPDPNAVPHDLKTILNESNNSFLRIAVAGTKLFTGNGAILEEKDSGYSGKPLFMVDFRPEQSVEAYLYIADQNKFVKLSVSDELSPVGIVAPTKAAVWSLAAPEKKVIDKISTGSEANWNNLTGSAGAPSLESRVDTTVSAYLADGVLPNFVSIVPVAITNINQGSVVTIGVEDIIVEEVIPAGLNAGVATINKISYDFGNAGAATIVLSVSNPELRRNSILQLGGVEFVRIEDVTRDSSGIPSIKVTTVGTFAAGATVTGFSSFRAYTPIAFVAGNTIKNDALKSDIGTEGISSITRVVDIDLLSTGTRSLTLDSVLHISLATDPSKITEIQVQLDVGDGAFQEYYFYAISPNFFTASVTQTTPTIAVIQQSLQRQQLLDQAQNVYSRLQRFGEGGYDPGVDIDDIYNGLINNYYNNPQTVLGLSQWSELHIRLGDFKKVGADNTKTLKNVKAIRVTLNTTEATDLSIDSIWVGGADSLDNVAQTSFPYNYVWRVRDPKTRDRSNWSPPLRTGIKLARGGVQLNFPDAAANYPANYRIDVARIGGTQTSFRIVGAIKNDGSQFIDNSPDRLVADNDQAGRFSEHGSLDAVFDFFKPFAILDTPKRGKCNVVGTKLTWTSGDKFNITYPRGTLIVVDGKANTFYTNPTTDTEVELELDLGALTDVEFEIEDPLLTGQPLPVIAGLVGEGYLGLYIFGCGDKNAAGTIYWLDGNSPATQSDTNRLEITSPSEPLVSIVIYDGYAQVYSTARSFTMQPTIDSNGNFSFIARENANSRGLFCRNAITVGPKRIYFLPENADGIYGVEGNGNPQCITAGGFANLFFNNGEEPSTTKLIDGTIIYPPDFTAIDELRLFCTNDYLFFRFKDINEKFVALVYDIELENFISYDTYEGHNANAFYKEELKSGTNILVGTVDGVGKFSSNGEEVGVTSKVIPFSFDAGDSRILKEFKEIIVDADNGLEGFIVRNFYNNGTESDLNQDFAGNIQHDRQQFIINLQDSDGIGKIAKNITTVFEWDIASGVKLYEEIIYLLPKADQIINRSGDTETNGNLGAKLWQGVVLRANTFGENKELKFYDDKNILRATLVINHDKEQTISYGFNRPFISHTIKRTSTDGVVWILLDEAYVTDVEPESAKVWEGEFNTHDLTGLILIERFGIAYRSYGSPSTLILTFEDETIQTYVNVLPNTDGEYDKKFFFAIPKKWKACKYRIESLNDIRIYKRDSEVWMKSVGSQQPFTRFSPIGGSSRQTEILI